jgi:hypothetical protein
VNTKQVIVEVRDDHISRGEKEDCAYCPVALAINELLDPNYHSEVANRHAVVYSEASAISIFHAEWLAPMYETDEVPEELFNFVEMFDNEIEVKPFSFKISLPAEILKDKEIRR